MENLKVTDLTDFIVSGNGVDHFYQEEVLQISEEYTKALDAEMDAFVRGLTAFLKENGFKVCPAKLMSTGRKAYESNLEAEVFISLSKKVMDRAKIMSKDGGYDYIKGQAARIRRYMGMRFEIILENAREFIIDYVAKTMGIVVTAEVEYEVH